MGLTLILNKKIFVNSIDAEARVLLVKTRCTQAVEKVKDKIKNHHYTGTVDNQLVTFNGLTCFGIHKYMYMYSYHTVVQRRSPSLQKQMSINCFTFVRFF